MRMAKYLFGLILLNVLLLACSEEVSNMSLEQDAIKGRAEYEFRRLVAPDGAVPKDIRKEELTFAYGLDAKSNRSSRGMAKYIWQHRGPFNVGGRTRGVVQDIANPNVIIAGGVSGGLWRSTDKGASWNRAISTTENPGISCLIQDTREGHQHEWYYGTGETLGNSASDYAAYFLGNGVYMSNDSGKTWTNIESTAAKSLHSLNDKWDLVNGLAINTANTNETELYAASHGAIMRTVDGGENWTEVLDGSGLLGTSMHTDIKITSTGTKYAFVSSDYSNPNSGVWVSETGEKGDWTEITPDFAGHNFERMILEIDPVDEKTLYVFGYVPGEGNIYTSPWHEEDTSYASLWRYDIENDSWADISKNLPKRVQFFDGLNLQGGYDLICEVSPHNQDHIFVGGTNLFVSTDGANSDDNWNQIGGYRGDAERYSTYYRYANHHPDQHAFLFDRSVEYGAFSAHDGGISLTSDYRKDSVEWSSLSNGYYTTQCHAVTMNYHSTDDIIISGFQDNGSLYTGNKDIEDDWEISLFGDGSYAAISSDGKDIYCSSQNSNIRKVLVDDRGKQISRHKITPKEGKDFLFINPFILDPNDDKIMYMLGGRKVWRQNDLSQFDASVTTYDKVPAAEYGWEAYSDSIDNAGGILFTTLKATQGTDRRLYIGAIGKVYRMDNPQTGDPEMVEIFDGIPSAGYVTDIAIDPNDPDKLMVVLSNYKIYSAYYSEDAGETFIKVAGNLEERPSGSGSGPSFRTATIMPLINNKTAYIVGTSTGLYATDTMIDDSTVWFPVAEEVIGHAVVEMIRSRTTDHTLLVGTHGNGVFSAKIDDFWKLTGVEDSKFQILDSGLKVYPSPARSTVHIDWKYNLNKIEIFDQLGRKVLEENLEGYKTKAQLNITELEQGLYLIKAYSDQGLITSNFVKTN